MSLTPEAADALFDEIVRAAAQGDRPTAVRLSVSALAQGLDEPLVLLFAAEDLDAQGRGLEALDLLRQAAEMAPEEAEVWYGLGVMRLRQGLQEEGLADLGKALKLQPDMLPALSQAAAFSYRLGRLTEAELHYRRIMHLTPDAAEAPAALAAIAARQRKTGEARSLAEAALARQPGNFTAEMAWARADLIDGLAHAVPARMDRLLGRPDIGDSGRIAALDLRAEAWDALDRPDPAFADYQRRNALVRDRYAARVEREFTERRIDQARRLVRSFSSTAAAPWRESTGPDKVAARAGCRHVFLLGFPRSGTTLLEKVLASHPEVLTLEEVDHLGALGPHWLANDAGIAELALLPAQLARPAREQYWQRVQDTIGSQLVGKTVLDKLPLHTLSMPVIAKLFPDARILFALRDPRDVVLSCFRRRFQFNPAMFELLALDGAAQYYSEVMTLARLYRGILPVSVLEVRHEHMVQAFGPTVRGVLDFIGAEWDPALTGFADHLPADPRTPSDVQLRRGLNAEGVGQWRRYSSHLAPAMETLAPWVRHFGYADPTS